MLAGHPPFHSEKRYRAHIVRGRFYPMKGPSWEKISDAGKDLVSKILDKNPESRFSLEDILCHPWLRDVESKPDDNISLGEAYKQRIKHLAARSKLKRCFVETSITRKHLYKKESFQSELPFLDNAATVMENECVTMDEFVTLSKAYNGKLLKLKELMVNSIYEDADDENQASKRRRISQVNIDYEQFCVLMESVDLGMLANPQIFSIFDEDGNGVINSKEFLFALMALRSGTDINQEEEAAQLYFSLFDVDEDGWISKDEMVGSI